MFVSTMLGLSVSYCVLPFLGAPMYLGLFLVYTSLVMGMGLGYSISMWGFSLIVLVFTGGMMVMSLYVFSFSSVLKVTWSGLVLGLGGFMLVVCFSLVGAGGFSSQGFVLYSALSLGNSELVIMLLLYLLFVVSFVVDFVIKRKGSFKM